MHDPQDERLDDAVVAIVKLGKRFGIFVLNPRHQLEVGRLAGGEGWADRGQAWA